MNISVMIAAAAAGICVLSAAATCIYRAGYEKVISARLAAGVPAGQKRRTMLPPFVFFWISAAVLGVLLLMILSVVSVSATGGAKTLRVSRCSADGITGMLNEQHEISGYDRHTWQDGAFQFVYYVQNQTGDTAFPQILLYVKSEAPFSYQYQLHGRKETSLTYAQQGTSGWYAVNCEECSGKLRFICENNTGSGSVEIDVPQS